MYTQFRLKRRLGAGSFGEVYEVECLENGMLYAAKLQSKSLRGANLPKEHDVYKKVLGSIRRSKLEVLGTLTRSM